MTTQSYTDIFQRAKTTAGPLAWLDDEKRNQVLLDVADTIIASTPQLLEANARDLAKMSPDNPLYDRLQLTEERLSGIAADMRHVATLPSPLGRVLKERTLPNGLHLRRVAVPFGVIGIIYEARPNVTFDVFSLCFKSGNACLLKGGKDADESNRAGVSLIQSVLLKHGLSPDVVQLMPATHDATAALLQATGYVDLCIPRGSKRLITMVRDTAKVPVIETGAGVVHAFVDQSAQTDMARAIIFNAKTRRPSVCNTLDTLLIHRSRLADLPALCAPMAEKGVRIWADGEALAALEGAYPAELLRPSTPDTWDTEWMSLSMGVRTVGSLDDALAHIAAHGSGHSECIVTDDAANARRFEQLVDAACVYWNAPTSFTDGAQFGLGAEIGISTQKLGARGPMALEEITTYKWIIKGEGQIRK